MPSTVTLSLISHTNAGKTTLARTLLRSDVGEVRDAAHVTLFNTAYPLIESGEAELILWDTPGFGDSARLLVRLRRMERGMVWFFSQMWDRMTDKPLWCAQQALKNVREEADVVLYLANASESLNGGTFVQHEMEILDWIGKPVLVLLNQTGAPRPAAEEAAEEQAWREHLQKFPIVKQVLSLDAFTRCWVQERVLMEHIDRVLAEEKKETMTKLRKAWQRRNEDIFQGSMRVLSHQLTANALDGVPVKPESFLQKIGFKRGELEVEWSEARQKLSESLAGRAEQAMNRLIEIHGLEGRDEKGEMLRSAKRDFAEPQHVEAAVWGALSGIASGALAGVVVDLKAGGLTFGGGALLGGIGGGLGAYALIKSYNLVRGDDNKLHWSKEHFREQVKLALLSYLAVAHFGRGRGSWTRDARPAHWQREVDELVESYREMVDHVWEHASDSKVGIASMNEEMELMMRELGKDILRQLYPLAERR
ncbi:GTPase domain-containing protein [Phragmitibacter flavus]|uniref:GTPase domain-containing protein n=1 Tax=Phragmitibacter flavus TaxID=2576071 RepID=A0A5R8KD77_9BACT|nr:GTPase domain-containing protein [Phragmitibacter flavus]TLD70243.1 GTPase domain-containing protein [Phragmitibacter flavus]